MLFVVSHFRGGTCHQVNYDAINKTLICIKQLFGVGPLVKWRAHLLETITGLIYNYDP